jgi:VWFA-related protein
MRARTGGLFISGAAVFALASSIAVSAQERPAAPPLVIKVGVDLIQIDASVTDKSGRPVTDLRAEDFTLEVDGQKQPIANAAHFGRSLPGAEQEASASPSEGNPYAESIVVFVIDDLNMSYKSMYDAKRSLARFAEEMGPSRPLMALRRTSDEDMKFSLYRSADRLASAVDDLKYNIRSSKGIFPESAVTAPVFMGRPGDRTTRGQAAVPVSMSGRTPAQEAQNLEQRAFSLVSTINTLRAFPGRKAVVLVSEGFWVDNQTRDRFGAGLPVSSVFDDTDVGGAVRLVTEVANRASVVLYPVDPRGLLDNTPSVVDNVTALQADNVSRSRWESRTGSQASLQYLADDTGGLADATRNDLQGGFADVLRDQTSYYLVGFEPPQKTFVKSSGRPRFHKIALSVNRAGVRVRTRAGFYGVTDEEVRKRAPLTASEE